jgi:hypothetical protein
MGIFFLVAAFFYGFVGLPVRVPPAVLMLLKFATPFTAFGLVLWVFRRLHEEDEAEAAPVRSDDTLLRERYRLRELREEGVIGEDEFHGRMKRLFL